MEGLNEKEAKILSLLKKYAAEFLNDPNTEDMIVIIVLAASEYGKEDEIISILDDPDNYGLGFDSITDKIIAILPPVEIADE